MRTSTRPRSSSWRRGWRWRTSVPASMPDSDCGAKGSPSGARSLCRLRRTRCMTPPEPDADVARFEEWRPLLFGIAYRMLGSAADAVDIVQEASIRWLGRRERDVESVRAYLVTIVTHLGMDLLTSARMQ